MVCKYRGFGGCCQYNPANLGTGSISFLFVIPTCFRSGSSRSTLRKDVEQEHLGMTCKSVGRQPGKMSHYPIESCTNGELILSFVSTRPFTRIRKPRSMEKQDCG